MNILIVDDSITMLNILKKNITKWGHTVYTSENGVAAWEKLKTEPVDIVISDWMMPEMNGIELCKKLRKENNNRYVYFIVISVENNLEKIVYALNSGADDYIAKPVNFDELKARLGIGTRIVNLEKALKNKYKIIKKNYFQTIQMFLNLLDVYNEKLGGHSRRVSRLSLKIATMHPDISENEYQIIEAAGLLHDIGMIGLPCEILTKKRTELNSDEKQQFLSHCVRGEIMLNEIEFMRPISKLIRSHHEQYNGKGFPDGLTGEEIPLQAQIISAASIYDNLVHRGKMPLEDIPGKLYQFKDHILESSIVNCLLSINLKHIEEENRKQFIEVSINNLEKGMRLARDVRMKTGAIIIPESTKLTRHSIEKLLNYKLLNQFDQKVYIYKNLE